MKFNDLWNGIELTESKLNPSIPNNIHNQASDNQDAGNVKDLSVIDISVIDIVNHYLMEGEIITRWDK